MLDEPTAGMDPEARRYVWSVVSRISQKNKHCAVILTTHSMEEAEALSTKMAIMVKGGVFKCFGSSQQIKSTFGTGYEIEIKINKIDNEALRKMADTYGFDKDVESVTLPKLMDKMDELKIDPFLIKEVTLNGMGEDLVKESLESTSGKVSILNFLLWLYIEQAGMNIVNQLV